MVFLTSAANAADIVTGLVGHWKLDGNGTDSTGRGNNGTVSGATAAVDRFGVANAALSFNGSNNYVDVGHVMDGATVFTWSAWIITSLNSAPAQYYNAPAIIGNRQGGGASLDVLLVVYGANLAWYDELGGVEHNFTTSTVVNDNVWHLVAVVRNGTALTFFVDGVSVGATTCGANGINALGSVIAPFAFPVNNYFSGRIDDARMYNRALSSDDVLALYNNNGWSTTIRNASIRNASVK